MLDGLTRILGRERVGYEESAKFGQRVLFAASAAALGIVLALGAVILRSQPDVVATPPGSGVGAGAAAIEPVAAPDSEPEKESAKRPVRPTIAGSVVDQLQSRIKSEGLKDVLVTSDGRAVHLLGWVHNASDRARAQQLAAQVVGEDAVDNDIRMPMKAP